MPIQAIQIGNFHPLLVHLPIGILIFAFILELFHRKKQSEASRKSILLALGIGVLTALFSLGTGWLLGNNGGYDETMLFWHRWMAVTFTVCAVLLFLLKRFRTAWRAKIYFPMFVLVIILLGITGHLGGNITHGEDFLFSNNGVGEIAITNVEEAKVYADIIRPIFKNKCVSCHNATKAKGGLVLTSTEKISKGGDSGNILDSVSDQPPRILQRIHLPLTEKEHMPPKGKVQLTPDEIALLEWWIANKNCFDCQTKDLKKDESLEVILTSLEADTSLRAQIAKEVDKVPEDWLASLYQQNISVHSLDEKSPLLIVNMAGRKDIRPKTLDLLKKQASNIVELNLGNSNFSDTLSPLLDAFKNLTKLQLQRTPITNETVVHLKKLVNLESLNLYGTNITDASLGDLNKLTHLKNLYLYQTAVTANALKAYSAQFPSVTVEQVKGDVFADTSLEPPLITYATEFFKDSLQVSLDYVFKDVDLYYTIDGTDPDSTSAKYTAPITLRKSCELKAVTDKKGWRQSAIAKASFKKYHMDVDSVWLDKPPNKKFTANKGKTLIDLKRGTTNFVGGNWLGYEGSNFTATLRFKQAEELSEISIGTLTVPGSWILFPVGCVISVSRDGKNFTKIHSEKFPAQKPGGEVSQTFFDVAVPPTTTKYVKIEIKSPLKNPKWHPAPGGKSWIFIDEIIPN